MYDLIGLYILELYEVNKRDGMKIETLIRKYVAVVQLPQKYTYTKS